MDDFETRVRRRTAFTVGYEVASCGGFRDVMELQQYASGQQHLATPDQVKRLALFFGIRIPPGYGAAPEGRMSEEIAPARTWFANLAPQFAVAPWKRSEKKPEPPPPPEPVREKRPAPYQPADQARMAQKATDLEKQIRANIWSGHISPALAHTVGLSLAELIDFSSGVTRLSAAQVTVLAMKMGLIPDAPKTAIDAIRSRLVNLMKKRPADFVSHLEWRGGDTALRDFVEGDAGLTLDELNHLAGEFWGKGVDVDPETAMLRRPVSSEPTSMGNAPPPFDLEAHFRRAGAYPPRIEVRPGPPPLYPRPPDAESKPARLASPGWRDHAG